MKERKTVTAKNPEDLINIAARILRFWPQDSLVVLKFGGTGETPQFRIDMPHTHEALGEVLTGLEVVTPYFQDGRAVMILFTDDAAMWTDVALGLVGLWPGVEWIDTLRVHDGHYYHLIDPERALPYTEHDIDGYNQTPAQSREDREREIRDARPTEEFLQALAREHATVRMYPLRAQAQWIVDTFTDRIDPLTDEELALLVANLQAHGINLRDVVLSVLNADHYEMLLDAAKRGGPNVHLRALLGFSAWLAGDGAMGWIARDLVHEIDENYSLMEMLEHILSNGIPPSIWAPPALDELPALKDGERP